MDKNTLRDKMNSTRFILAVLCLFTIIINSPVFCDLKIHETILNTLGYVLIAYMAARTWEDVSRTRYGNNLTTFTRPTLKDEQLED